MKIEIWEWFQSIKVRRGDFVEIVDEEFIREWHQCKGGYWWGWGGVEGVGKGGI